MNTSFGEKISGVRNHITILKKCKCKIDFLLYEILYVRLNQSKIVFLIKIAFVIVTFSFHLFVILYLCA